MRLAIFDVQGREVARLVDRTEAGGAHSVRWNGLTRSGGPAAGGIYFYRLGADGGAAAKGVAEDRGVLSGRMLLLR